MSKIMKGNNDLSTLDIVPSQSVYWEEREVRTSYFGSMNGSLEPRSLVAMVASLVIGPRTNSLSFISLNQWI